VNELMVNPVARLIAIVLPAAVQVKPLPQEMFSAPVSKLSDDTPEEPPPHPVAMVQI
jgi:hypothetical protein